MAAKANIRRAGLRHTGRAGVSQRTDSTVGRVARGGTVVPEGGLTIKPDEGSQVCTKQREGVEGSGDMNGPLRLQSAFTVGIN